MDQDRAIQEFLTSAGKGDPDSAREYLEMTDWNVQGAVQAFLMDEEEGEQEAQSERNAPISSLPGQPAASGPPPPPPAGGRRLGDGSASGPQTLIPSASSAAPSRSSNPNPSQRKKFGSLAELTAGSSSGHGGHGHDDDDSDKEQEFFTGGDKSGLAVQDPRSRDHIQRLMDTARRNAPRPPRADGEEDAPQRPNYFGGGGHTLGGEDVETQYIPGRDQNGSHRAPEMVERTLHLWADGFSVDDGPLYRYDDPANARTLELINSGSAPLDIMNVEAGQAVDVKLDAHRGENYVQPKPKYKPFSGSGQRLGSPTPGASTTTSTSVSNTDRSATVEVDESQPTVNLQIRLVDGTRLPARFNPTHTIGDVYDFVNRASPASAERPYALATTFPTKELADKSLTLGDMAELKKGGVVVQKWS